MARRVVSGRFLLPRSDSCQARAYYGRLWLFLLEKVEGPRALDGLRLRVGRRLCGGDPRAVVSLVVAALGPSGRPRRARVDAGRECRGRGRGRGVEGEVEGRRRVASCAGQVRARDRGRRLLWLVQRALRVGLGHAVGCGGCGVGRGSRGEMRPRGGRGRDLGRLVERVCGAAELSVRGATVSRLHGRESGAR